MQETVAERKRKLQKIQITDYLTEKNVYTPAYDFHIDLLLDQIQLYYESREIIKAEGLSVSGNAVGGFMVRSQHVKTLTECISNIKGLSKILGLSVADSIIFKQLNTTEEDTDDFDSAIDTDDF